MNSLRYSLLVLYAALLGGCASVEPVATTATRPVPMPVPEITSSAPPAAGGNGTRPAAVVKVDIWTRLRDGFEIDAADHAAVRKAVKKYGRTPRDVEQSLARGDPYLAYILDAVEQRGYPAEIALLPFVESSFDPFAYSHGRAAGLWQFIPGTAKMYGLRQDWWYDERRDVIASTGAALDYLGKLHRQFDGDWLLALAAYNSGSGTVRGAMRRNRKAGKPQDFWHLKLPRETRAYVPRLMAICEIVRHPDHYDIALPALANEPAFAEVDTGGQLDIGVAAELADVEADVLYRLNPGFNRWATHPDGPHRLLVPAERTDEFYRNLATLDDEQRLKWVRHRIKSGQTLSEIAQQYDTTVAVLRSTNQLRGTTIRAGRHLLVPVAARDATRYAALEKHRGPSGRGNRTTYKVRDGDSLWIIARNHDVSVRQVARWNQIGTNAVIRPGQRLVIWQRGGKGNSKVRSINYTVRSGDSLYHIARKFSVSIADLRRWNSLDSDKYLQPGQRLTLYVDVTRLTSG